MDDMPRRIQLDKMEPVEKTIREAMEMVEYMGADVKLTDAIMKLDEALGLVSDFIDKTK